LKFNFTQTGLTCPAHLAALRTNAITFSNLVFRWFFVYRQVLRRPFPLVNGTLYELVAMFELLPAAYLHYRMDADMQRRMHYFELPLLQPETAENSILSLKRLLLCNHKARKRDRKPDLQTSMLRLWTTSEQAAEERRAHFSKFGISPEAKGELLPTREFDPYIDHMYQWLSLYRDTVGDSALPLAVGTPTEIFFMSDLMDAALCHYEAASDVREAMDQCMPLRVEALEETNPRGVALARMPWTRVLSLLRAEIWAVHVGRTPAERRVFLDVFAA
jgi:hypothetical protein